MDKLTIRDFDPAGKRVLVRVDFNVPIEDGRVKDDTRVRAALPTIRYLISRGAAVVLLSHLGRPNGKVVESARLRPVAQRLSGLLGMGVPVTGDALGLGTRDAVMRLKPGQVLMLENLRFHAEEEANDPEYAATLASYGEIYVNDAFGSAHRAHASTVGIARLLPAYSGLLMEAEVKALSTLLESPPRPFAAVIGGAKVSTKLAVMENLIAQVDTLLIGGGMANTFLVAQGHSVGKSLLERDLVPEAQRLLELAAKRKVELLLPTDVVVAKEVTRGAEHKIVSALKIPNSWSVVDIGPQTTAVFTAALETARTVLWNGPLGVFEVPTFGDGTRAMARYLARRADAGASVIVGGGDSAAAVEELGLTPRMTHVSTGGGASLEFLEGRELPGVAALQDRVVEKLAPPVRIAPPAAPKAPPKPAAQAPAKVAASARAKAVAAARPMAPTAQPKAAATKTPAKPTSKPTVAKPAAKPAAKPVAKAPAAKAPAAKQPAAKPVAKKPAAKVGAKKPIAKKPVAKKPAAKPAARKPLAKAPARSTARKSSAKPAVRKAPAKPAPKRPVAKAVANKPVAKAVAKKPVAKKPLAKSASKSTKPTRAAPKPATKPAAKAKAKPAAKPARPASRSTKAPARATTTRRPSAAASRPKKRRTS